MSRLASLVAALALLAACDRSAPTSGPTPTPATSAAPAASKPSMAQATSLHTLSVKRLDGTEESLSAYAGKVLLVVNTASECGYTPQYESLQAVHAKYAARGFSVLGFPSNDFGAQEPGSNQEIAEFCRLTYGVQFPMFAKTTVVGTHASPLYAQLARATGEVPQWNFHKYLIDRSGTRVLSFGSRVKPDDRELLARIEEFLGK